MKKIILIAFLIILISAIAYARIKTPNLQAGFAMEGNANDWSGNGNNGTVTGATLATGKFGQAYSFDGVNDYIRITNSTSIQSLSSAMTISLWAYKKDTVSGIMVNNHIQNIGTPVSGFIFTLDTGNDAIFQLRLGNACCQTLTIDSNLGWNNNENIY